MGPSTDGSVDGWDSLVDAAKDDPGVVPSGSTVGNGTGQWPQPSTDNGPVQRLG